MSTDDERIWFTAYCNECDKPYENIEWYFRDYQYQMLQVQMLDEGQAHLGVAGSLMDDASQFKLDHEFDDSQCDDVCGFKEL